MNDQIQINIANTVFNLNRLQLLFELIFSDTLTHGSCRGNTTSDSLQQVINVFSTRPFLMLDNFNTQVDFRLLNVLSIGFHTDFSVFFRELVDSQGSCMQPSQCDELPDVTQLTQSLNVAFLVSNGHGCVPVERWGQVVGQPLVWNLGLDTFSKFLSLSVVWKLGFHPDDIGVRSKLNTTVDSTLSTTLVSVVTFTNSWSVPVEVDFLTQQLLGKSSSLLVGNVR
ncbi:hypothetical protein WICPIJ_004850 [Wickerhamomyces pijperi]|uniref:Uncharacterized protein n=1 Tax=Wickerhamomyces pijperi TaxID=599730 RepID=A0A9P8Q6Y4_WICPI|nr:hypothetical protein WICPIJ_004850 [Wickerhamomyces pijperi]